MDTDNKAKIPAFDTDMKHTATNIVGEHGLDTPMNLSIEGGHEKAITEAIVMDESIHDNLLSISDMAKLHGLTRPTLLYYDSIGLFHRFLRHQMVIVIIAVCRFRSCVKFVF